MNPPNGDRKNIRDLHKLMRKETGSDSKFLLLITPNRGKKSVMVISDTPHKPEGTKHLEMVEKIQKSYGTNKYSQVLKENLLNPTIPIYNFLYTIFNDRFDPLKTSYWTHSSWGKIKNAWLKKEIELIEPKILITLGSNAVEAVNMLESEKNSRKPIYLKRLIMDLTRKRKPIKIKLNERIIEWFPLLHPSGQNQGHINELGENYRKYLLLVSRRIKCCSN